MSVISKPLKHGLNTYGKNCKKSRKEFVMINTYYCTDVLFITQFLSTYLPLGTGHIKMTNI